MVPPWLELAFPWTEVDLSTSDNSKKEPPQAATRSTQQSTANTMATNPPPQPASAQHTRTYQACIPCRRRKVRCDLGPVDNPHDPPCVRCRRESKECFFSATRRKRKGQDGADDYDELDDYEMRNGRKRHKTADDPHAATHLPQPSVNPADTTNAYISQPLTPGGSIGRYEPLRRPATATQPQNDEEDRKMADTATAVMQTGEIYSGHDALNLLFQAAGRDLQEQQHHRTGSTSSAHRPSMGSTPGSQTNLASPQAITAHARNPSRVAAEPIVDPALAHQSPGIPDPPNEAAFNDAVKAWSKFRFVRAGWLTAKEAVRYIDYFYTYLSPLTPIVVPDYRDHAMHGKLLREEPMLVITLLTIASRFRTPDTPSRAGAVSRSYLIHDKFWKYLQGMIDRTIYGQEQFGGGFCGAGQQPGSDVNPLTRKGLRTLGTVESLMLLTEWHPRALHFPPGDDDDELVPIEDDVGGDAHTNTGSNNLVSDGGQRIDSWLEPCWRSDRMCWMLLGNALSLAYEIGVFDDTSEVEFEEANQHLSHATVKAYFRRKNHLKNLLVIYVTQTSGRLGLTSMLPKTLREDELQSQRTPLELYNARKALIKAPPLHHSTRPDGQRLPLESVATQERHAIQDLVLDFWDRIAKTMEMGNLKLFPNRRKTRELLKSGKYEELLKGFQTPLLDWKRGFDQAPQVPALLRHVLTIEYEYTRVYLNSLALQAVVERCTHNTPLQPHAQPNGAGAQSNSRTSDSNGGAIPFSTLVKWYGNDRHHIREVVDASRCVLKVVVDDLYPHHLRHAPVRTFFRIVSVAIICLKTFALGATEDDVAITLGLLDRAVFALRTSIVDDVHVGNRFADLVDTLTHRIRGRFVRLAANGGGTNSAGISRPQSPSPPQTRGQTPMMPPPPPLMPQQQQQQSFNQQQGFPFSQPTGSSAPGSPGIGITASGRATPIPSHPLFGISSEPYDPNSNSISIMPPPGFNTNNYTFNAGNAASSGSWQHWSNAGGGVNNNNTNNNNGGSGNGNGAYDQDWLALPLDPLLDQWGADINQTAMGPDIGGLDMLDILLNMGGPPGSA
ncbi:hypothetical protein DM02DRAFT_128401 [Periconia macrospinosa]|uniref:Zn(2)-C6 fungal-type domain-containing protein n=1 Tax=Periconia macrospinosa TaxID=97972 RepID=A0A2V1DGF1_9PLEO|nr:hypothetical protein DM02DRAFT_128401 [Periconia macrospinosa]